VLAWVALTVFSIALAGGLPLTVFTSDEGMVAPQLLQPNICSFEEVGQCVLHSVPGPAVFVLYVSMLTTMAATCKTYLPLMVDFEISRDRSVSADLCLGASQFQAHNCLDKALEYDCHNEMLE
jgi:hypothetical protein